MSILENVNIASLKCHLHAINSNKQCPEAGRCFVDEVDVAPNAGLSCRELSFACDSGLRAITCSRRLNLSPFFLSFG